jgi:predicted small secreted protein
MKTKLVLLISLVAVISTALAACGGIGAGNENDDGAEDLPPVAVVRAREVLAAELNLEVESIDIENYDRAEWSDSCLGLGGPAESCLAVITPGWQVEFSVDGGETYEVRTDELGEVVRIKQ